MLLVFGIGPFARSRWAAAGAIALAMLSSLVNFIAIGGYDEKSKADVVHGGAPNSASRPGTYGAR